MSRAQAMDRSIHKWEQLVQCSIKAQVNSHTMQRKLDGMVLLTSPTIEPLRVHSKNLNNLAALYVGLSKSPRKSKQQIKSPKLFLFSFSTNQLVNVFWLVSKGFFSRSDSKSVVACQKEKRSKAWAELDYYGALYHHNWQVNLHLSRITVTAF